MVSGGCQFHYHRLYKVRLSRCGGGTTPAAPDPGNSDTGTYNPTVAVTDVQAVNAVVADANGARMRGDASANSGIVKQVAGNSTVTVTGQATGDDGNIWYRVVYNDGSAEYTGFIRNDYLQLGGEVLPIDNGGDANVDNGDSSNDSGIDISKDYDTQKDGDDWYLIDNNAKAVIRSGYFGNCPDKLSDCREKGKDSKDPDSCYVILVSF